jgi:hypothetical protein
VKKDAEIQKIEVAQGRLQGESTLCFHFEAPVPVFKMWFPPGATAAYLAAILRQAAERMEAEL